MRLIVPMLVFVVAVVLLLGEPELIFRPVAHFGAVVQLPDMPRGNDGVVDGPILLAATE
jgi:hypothetical protein